ncbi:ATP-dependent helicase [Oceanobacillus sp. J11TS1]|uniref:ATP-dependent helicase n=1 Tax=Oceanobacillus sp. J11TS1 TaxID=2807191 RepID=UPI001B0AED81|nr:ATP-dependent helicase [Oceanobacillus sp. J11TS1]GIO23464.1 DNA helicase [Oceanobacillus sp. J11TS1]
MTDLYTKKLNQIKIDKEQYDAFLSNKSTVVKAGPGSGKTTVLTVKIMNLLKEKIKEPRGLACITFSNEAVSEFTSRLNKMGYQKRKNIMLSTVHSFCISEIIIPFAKLYNKNISLPLSIISEKGELFQSILGNYSIDRSQVKLEDMDNERNMLIGNQSKVAIDSNEQAKKVALEYEQRLKELGKVDFIEIVKVATELIEEQDYVRRCLEAKYPWILIDEYQDLGKPLHEMVLTLLAKTNIKFFIVGDPDQSIYSFQGGNPAYLKELFEKENIRSIELKTNYRSNQEIIDLSSIALNLDDREYRAGTRQGEKADIRFITCKNEMSDQYKYIINNIIPECIGKNIPFEEICILSKTWGELEDLSRAMDNANIPNYFAKQGFLKNQVIIWLKDCASWVTGSSAVSFTDIFEYWLKIISYIDEKDKLLKVRNLHSVLNSSKQHQNQLSDWVHYMFEELSIKDNIIQNEQYDDKNIAVLEDFYDLTLTGELKDYSVKRFSELGKPNNQVTLTTRHSSKGLEFEVIVLLGLEEGNFPFFGNVDDEYKLNEERRVFYVSLTRAKRVCYLLRSERITYRTGTRIKEPSMFWNELMEAVELQRKNK